MVSVLLLFPVVLVYMLLKTPESFGAVGIMYIFRKYCIPLAGAIGIWRSNLILKEELAKIKLLSLLQYLNSDTVASVLEKFIVP